MHSLSAGAKHCVYGVLRTFLVWDCECASSRRVIGPFGVTCLVSLQMGFTVGGGKIAAGIVR